MPENTAFVRRRWRWVGVVLAVSVAGLVTGCLRGSVRRLSRHAYTPLPARTQFTSWDEVFERGAKVELHSLDTGAVHGSAKQNLSAENPKTASYVDPVEPLQIYAHLLRHPTAGDLLVDSGLDASFATHPYGNLQWPTWWVLAVLFRAPFSQVPGDDLLAQLARLHAKPRTVYLTHMHMDHTGGLPALGPEVEVVSGPHEADDPPQIFGFGHFAGRTAIGELDFTGAGVTDLPPLGPAIDLLGDGSFWAVSTRGHTLGHVSFVVNSTQGPVLLTGDASHFRWAFENAVEPFGTSGDPAAVARASLGRLRDFSQRYPQVTVFTGHQAPAHGLALGTSSPSKAEPAAVADPAKGP